MAGFEVVVRPMIFPNIRPASRPSVVPAETDPEKGLVVIRGASGKTIDLPYSYSRSFTVTYAKKEKERKFDVARIYQKQDNGEVNRDNYVDVEVAKRITMKESGGNVDYNYAPVKPSDNVEILRKDLVRQAT
jgi:3-dehydroquinate synthase class II